VELAGSNLKPFANTYPHIKDHHLRLLDLRVPFESIEESHLTIQMLDNLYVHCVKWAALQTLMHILHVNRCK
jgi:hypothetical protein